MHIWPNALLINISTQEKIKRHVGRDYESNWWPHFFLLLFLARKSIVKFHTIILLNSRIFLIRSDKSDYLPNRIQFFKFIIKKGQLHATHRKRNAWENIWIKKRKYWKKVTGNIYMDYGVSPVELTASAATHRIYSYSYPSLPRSLRRFFASQNHSSAHKP